jgi:heparan-alpha-glucosaminide N-acetyltransferase
MGSPTPASPRLLSLDAYRGFTMLAMASSGLGLASLNGDPTWHWLADQVDHREWIGCTVWDLIQPSFLFIVGVAMPFSYARRIAAGDSWAKLLGHAVQRCFLLALIGITLDSIGERQLYVQFIRVLQQIALAYLPAFLMLRFGPRVQAAAAVLLLFVHSACYFAFAAATGRSDAWLPGDNFGTQLDVGLHLPLSKGHYVTFNFVSSASTILFGVVAGEVLRSDASPRRKLMGLVAGSLAGFASGLALAQLPEYGVPMIKRLWTASFTLFAVGWTALLLAGFYLVIDLRGRRRWAHGFVIVGVNSIAMYVFSCLWLTVLYRVSGQLFPLRPIVDPWKTEYPIAFQSGATAIKWLFCYALYRAGIYIKV